MNPSAEADVRIRIAGDVHGFGVFKYGFVAVCRTQQGRNLLAFANDNPTDFGVRRGGALEQVQRGIETQELINGGAGKLVRAFGEQTQLVWALH